MPSEHAHTYYFAVHVEPEHVKAFQTAVERDDEPCLMHDIEQTIGAHIGFEEDHPDGTSAKLNLFPRHIAYGDHGAGVAEVYLTDGR